MKSYAFPILLFLSISIFSQEQVSDNLSIHYYELGKKNYFKNPDSVLLYAGYIESLQDPSKEELQIKSSHLRGVYYQLKSESDTALFHFKKMLNAATTIQDSTMMSIAHLSKGLMYVNKGLFDSAMINYSLGEKIAYKIGERRYELRAMAEIARVFSLKGDHEKALKYCKKYYNEVKESDNGNDLATALAYLAVEFMHFHEHDSSLFYLNKTLLVQKKQNHLAGIAAAQQNKASVFQEINLIDSAVIYYERAIENYKLIGFTQGLGQIDLNLGSLYLTLNRTKEAIQSINRGIEFSKQINDLHVLSEQYQLLSKAYELVGLEVDAFDAYKNYHILYDSLNKIEKEIVTTELQTKYETEKKEQRIELQNAQLSEQEVELQRNQILLAASFLAFALLISIGLLQRNRLKKKQQLKLKQAELRAREVEINATISSQERERARYARDLHDGFGQMISVLNMNLKNLEDGAKPDERQKVFQESNKVIEEMYGELKNICFDLMPQTLIKHGLESALNEFAARINQTGKIFVELNIFGLEERLTELQEISLYRISQEWINNILKYSDAEKITLQITKDESEITLLIEDNGSGFDKSLLEQGKGNGWKNLNTRSKLIKGELELETSPNQKGSVLIVNAPTEIVLITNTPKKQLV